MNLFNKTYNENYKAIYRYALKMIGNDSYASDIVQESFILLYTKLKKGEVITNRKSWLFKVANNKCIDHFRAHKSEKLESDIVIASESYDNNEKHQIIRDAIDKLKKRDKILVTLYSENLSYKEISDVTGIKFSSVGKLLSRALAKLEKELKNKSYELY